MNTIEVNIKGFDQLQNRIKAMQSKMAKDIDEVLEVAAIHIATEAKQLAPKDEGQIAGSISADNSRFLEKHISVNAPHASFQEFGTGKYANQYIATLPQDWQTFASSFRGQKGGTFAQMILALTEWVHRKNIAGTYSVKTQRRTGNKSRQKQQDKQIAYAIALKILKNGIRPQPFLYPAFRDAQPQILENVNKVLHGL